MADLFDTRELPDDPHYWDSLAGRVAAAAVSGSKPSLIDWFGNSPASWVAASVLALLVFGVLVAPARRDATAPVAADWHRALAPGDDVATDVIVSETPPSIDVLLTRSAGEVRE